MASAPENFAQLVAEFQELTADIEFIRALRELKVSTVNGDLTLNYQPGSKNVSLDLRSLTPTGQPLPNVLPSQTTNAGKVLTTDGATLSWL